jgi:hypothetical protein
MRDGYCKHGKYVGGCGADLMCGWCESDTEPPAIAIFLLVKRGEDWTELGRPYYVYSMDEVHACIDEDVADERYGTKHAYCVENTSRNTYPDFGPCAPVVKF